MNLAGHVEAVQALSKVWYKVNHPWSPVHEQVLSVHPSHPVLKLCYRNINTRMDGVRVFCVEEYSDSCTYHSFITSESRFCNSIIIGIRWKTLLPLNGVHDYTFTSKKTTHTIAKYVGDTTKRIEAVHWIMQCLLMVKHISVSLLSSEEKMIALQTIAKQYTFP